MLAAVSPPVHDHERLWLSIRKRSTIEVPCFVEKIRSLFSMSPVQKPT